MFRRFIPLLIGVLLLAACGSVASNAPAAAPTAAPAAVAEPTVVPEGANELRKVTLAMSYIPNVQFSPYYVAASKGYYAEMGLEVVFDYNFENDVVQRVAQGSAEFAMASGLSVLLARQQGLPVATVMTLYQQFPVVFFSKARENITAAQDLKGKSLGIPGRFGASYYGLLALLYANKLQESDLNIQEIGFTQAQALMEDKVQVATGYAMNEPIALRQQGEQINVIRVADSFSLASDGLIVNEKLIAEDPGLVRSFVQATLRGVKETLEQTDESFAISMKQLPEAQGAAAQEFERAQLQETLPYWQSDQTQANGLGYTDPEVMAATHTFLRDSGLLQQDVDVSKAFTNEFLK
jgi:NitT/TauT family transport system substrate-binding protein